MRTQCSACSPSKVGGRASWLALTSGLLAVILPKCPLCIVAYLSLFGVTLGTASVALAVLRPLTVVIAALALGMIVLRRAR